MRSLFFLKSQNGYTPRRWPRARQLRSYSRDCFAPSQESSGERHAYDLVYLQDVDLSEFATRARAISPSLWEPVLQLNKTTDSSKQVFNQTQQCNEEQQTLTTPDQTITVKCTVLVAQQYPVPKEFHYHSWHYRPTASDQNQLYPNTGGGDKSVSIQDSCK